MTLLALAVALTTALIAILHAAWGLGLRWPIRDEAELARAIAGFKGIARMPGPGPSFAVAAALSAVAALALVLGGLAPFSLPAPLAKLAGLLAASVFLFRGALGFTARWAAITPEQPFRRLDRRYYSPLCLAIGAALVLLAWSHSS